MQDTSNTHVCSESARFAQLEKALEEIKKLSEKQTEAVESIHKRLFVENGERPIIARIREIEKEQAEIKHAQEKAAGKTDNWKQTLITGVLLVVSTAVITWVVNGGMAQ